MRKRGKQIQHRAKAAPGLVVQSLAKDYEIRLRSSVDAFRLNYAEACHFNDLADCVDMMTIAEATDFAKPDDGAVAVCQLASVALENIRDRYNAKRRFGATGEEIKALETLATTSIDYWNRRSGALYHYAYTKLKSIRNRHSQEAA